MPPPGSIFHVQKIEEFGKRIHSLLSTSSIASSYKFTEVFLLDRWVKDDDVTDCSEVDTMMNFKIHDLLPCSDPEGILVHFNLHFNSDKQSRLFNREIQVHDCTALC